MALDDKLLALVQTIGADIKAILPRLIPAGGTAGQVLKKSSASDYAVIWSNDNTGAGSTQTADAQVDFGLDGEGCFATVTVPATWVAAGSNFVVSPAVPTTTDHDAEDALLEELTASVQSITPGVSFVLGVHAPNGTWGRYDFNIIGV